MTPPHWAVSQYLLGDVVEWIRAIPFDAWPQQQPVDHQLRPAMVNDLAWHRFGIETETLVQSIMADVFPGRRDVNRMLSVVMPNHNIHPHADCPQPTGWLTRIHVPLVTNVDAMFAFAANTVTHPAFHMRRGFAYAIDVTQTHFVENHGTEPRIHLMFDVLETP